jgi:para-nitrobenzyl esterase
MLFLPPVSFPYGAYHGSEVQYLFEQRTSVPAPSLTAAQQQLAASMQAYWAAFARSGDPNNAQAPAWSAYQPTASDSYQSLVSPTPFASTGAAFGADHKCAVWGSP